MADWGYRGGGGIFYESSMLMIDSGTNNAPLVCCVCREPLGPRGITEDGGVTWTHLQCHSKGTENAR